MSDISATEKAKYSLTGTEISAGGTVLTGQKTQGTLTQPYLRNAFLAARKLTGAVLAILTTSSSSILGTMPQRKPTANRRTPTREEYQNLRRHTNSGTSTSKNPACVSNFNGFGENYAKVISKFRGYADAGNYIFYPDAGDYNAKFCGGSVAADIDRVHATLLRCISDSACTSYILILPWAPKPGTTAEMSAPYGTTKSFLRQ